jgi:hypothetical protein
VLPFGAAGDLGCLLEAFISVDVDLYLKEVVLSKILVGQAEEFQSLGQPSQLHPHDLHLLLVGVGVVLLVISCQDSRLVEKVILSDALGCGLLESAVKGVEDCGHFAG